MKKHLFLNLGLITVTALLLSACGGNGARDTAVDATAPNPEKEEVSKRLDKAKDIVPSPAI